ncbi:C_GCAxxG_C_C family protein [Prolixibacteraceae bacterium JC049]|nr:C_GCAxxG_C_C family protein [Prolixibacteraceae bacterium JC049]
MDRRKAMKLAAGAVVAGGAGLFTLADNMKPDYTPKKEGEKLDYKSNECDWKYTAVSDKVSAQIAYDEYPNGSCMYATFKSVIAQLSEKVGEPFTSFPVHMMKYGHGGIAGFGSTCGTINGAAALIGLFVSDKKQRDKLVAALFRWYERNEFPIFKPEKPALDADIPKSVSGSVLCHASLTNWAKASGHNIHDKERKERCRRLSADVAAKTTEMLNDFFAHRYISKGTDDKTVGTCMTCHGGEGKLDNTSGKMKCTSCHDESVAHKAFAGPHYKVMD